MHTVLINEPSPKKKRKRKRKRPKKKVAEVLAPVAVDTPPPQSCRLYGYLTEFLAIEMLHRISMSDRANEGMKPDRYFLCDKCDLWHLATTRARCVWTGKRKFHSEQHALRFKSRNKDGKNGMRSHYKCPKCNGWHLSSMDRKKYLKVHAEILEQRRSAIQFEWDKRLYGAKHL